MLVVITQIYQSFIKILLLHVAEMAGQNPGAGSRPPTIPALDPQALR